MSDDQVYTIFDEPIVWDGIPSNTSFLAIEDDAIATLTARETVHTKGAVQDIILKFSKFMRQNMFELFPGLVGGEISQVVSTIMDSAHLRLSRVCKAETNSGEFVGCYLVIYSSYGSVQRKDGMVLSSPLYAAFIELDDDRMIKAVRVQSGILQPEDAIPSLLN